MAKEVDRISMVDDQGVPITIIEFTHQGKDDPDPVSEFQVRHGNRTAKSFNDEKKALSFAEALGGKEQDEMDALAVAAEIGSTAAHQAAHAADALALAKLLSAPRKDEEVAGETDKSGESTRRARAARRRINERDDLLHEMINDSQATGVAPMHLGLRPDAAPVVVERVPGAAEGDVGKTAPDEGSKPSPTARANARAEAEDKK